MAGGCPPPFAEAARSGLTLLLCLGAGAAWAGEVATSRVDPPAVAVSRLPQCVSDPAQVARITASIKANSGKPAKLYLKYVAYEEAFAGESDADKVARLIYAEVVGANCAAESRRLVPLVAGVIGARVANRRGDVRSVVFEPDQFASSLNVYGDSRYRDFLCPRDAGLYAAAQAAARRALAGATDLPADAVHYFLYQHSPRWTKEPWRLPEHPVAGDLRRCLRVFLNRSWR